MKRKLILLCSTLAVLVLELLPFGAVCCFANPEGEAIRQTYSYFDLTPYAYANFAPFLVALLTCVLLGLLVAALVSRRALRRPILAVSVVAAILSLTPLLYGVRYFTWVAGAISVLLVLDVRLAFPKKALA